MKFLDQMADNSHKLVQLFIWFRTVAQYSHEIANYLIYILHFKKTVSNSHAINL